MALKLKRGYARSYVLNGEPVQLSDSKKSEISDVIIGNMSVRGMNFNSNIPMKPGDEIFVRAEDVPAYKTVAGKKGRHRARVIWCRKNKGGSSAYGIGVKFCSTLEIEQ